MSITKICFKTYGVGLQYFKICKYMNRKVRYEYECVQVVTLVSSYGVGRIDKYKT